jgi:hypothetical protein
MLWSAIPSDLVKRVKVVSAEAFVDGGQKIGDLVVSIEWASTVLGSNAIHELEWRTSPGVATIIRDLTTPTFRLAVHVRGLVEFESRTAEFRQQLVHHPAVTR